MNEEHFKTVQPLIEAAEERIPWMLQSAGTEQLRRLMQEVSAALPEEYELLLRLELSVFDPERGNSLPLIAEGISASGGREPFLASGDATVHRYVVDGHMCQVPHDYCPYCGGEWDFKLLHPQCPGCGYELGKQVKMLLDSNVCPNCEKGTVSMTNPKCEECGFEVDLKMVTWG
jgi:hypothetical protein